MMETRSSKRRKLQSNLCIMSKNSSRDRISELPDAILHQILCLLPLKTIAQTSVLSKRWRCMWLSFPDLDFTSLSSFSNSLKNLHSNKGMKRVQAKRPFFSKETSFIYNILSLRDKWSFDLRILRFCGHISLTCLGQLIRLAMRRNVQELDLELAIDQEFNIPRCIIRSGSLRVLRLKSHHHGIWLPFSSLMTSGFKFLESLSLSLVSFHEDHSNLQDLFTDNSFPTLKKLCLDSFSGLKFLKIKSPSLKELSLENFQLIGFEMGCIKLERLRITSCFDVDSSRHCWVRIYAPHLRFIVWEYNVLVDACDFKEMDSLHEASIGFIQHQDENIDLQKLLSLSNLISRLCHAHALTLENHCVEMLSENDVLRNSIIDKFCNLKSLELHTGFNRKNLIGLSYLFKNSPLLHSLTIKIFNDYKTEKRQWDRDFWDVPVTNGERYWESQAIVLKSFLHHLTLVKIHGFSEGENEISLVKFLLKHGKALQEMILCSRHCNPRDSLRRDKIKSQMMGFSWASSNAKIKFQ